MSPACEHCYAEALDRRLGGGHWGKDTPRRFFGPKHWREPFRWNARAGQTGQRERVFAGSMCDILEDRRDLDEWRQALWLTIEQTPMLDWLLLTKRPEYAEALMPRHWFEGHWPPHAWFGVTAENQKELETRMPHARKVPTPVLWISWEPGLGPLDLTTYASEIKWLVGGFESGAKARPGHPNWARGARDQCQRFGIPFFFKQWGELVTEKQSPEDIVLPGTSFTPWKKGNGQFDTKNAVYRVGKKAAGRLLDGVEWNEFPKT